MVAIAQRTAQSNIKLLAARGCWLDRTAGECEERCDLLGDYARRHRQPIEGVWTQIIQRGTERCGPAAARMQNPPEETLWCRHPGPQPVLGQLHDEAGG